MIMIDPNLIGRISCWPILSWYIYQYNQAINRDKLPSQSLRTFDGAIFRPPVILVAMTTPCFVLRPRSLLRLAIHSPT